MSAFRIIQSECGKMLTKITSNTDTSRSECQLKTIIKKEMEKYVKKNVTLGWRGLSVYSWFVGVLSIPLEGFCRAKQFWVKIAIFIYNAIWKISHGQKPNKRGYAGAKPQSNRWRIKLWRSPHIWKCQKNIIICHRWW